MDEPRPPSPRRPLRRLLLGCLGLVGLLLLLLLGGYGYYQYRLSQDLEAAIAEAIAADPALTIEEMVAALEPIPANENSAPRIIAAAKALPDLPELGKELSKRRPNERFNEEELMSLTDTLRQAAPALDRLRGLEDLPRGRHDVRWHRISASTSIAHSGKTRTVYTLLVSQAVALAEDQRPDEALIACRAALNASRSLRDDPGWISMLFRIVGHSEAMRGVERILGQQVPSEGALAVLQRTIEEEERAPMLMTALRGERASSHEICALVAAGEISLSHFTLGLGRRSLRDHAEDFLARQMISQSHAYCLRYFTDLMRIAQGPAHELKPGQLQLQTTLDEQSEIARLIILATDKSVDTYLTNLAHLRCTSTALAAERFRLRHARWPDSLADLKPDFIQDVPLDPFDGQPLRFKPTDDGVIVYSIGRNAVDDNGRIRHLNRTIPALSADIGFQLWHPEQRGLKPD